MFVGTSVTFALYLFIRPWDRRAAVQPQALYPKYEIRLKESREREAVKRSGPSVLISWQVHSSAFGWYVACSFLSTKPWGGGNLGYSSGHAGDVQINVR
jgi:hypothetical protein